MRLAEHLSSGCRHFNILLEMAQKGGGLSYQCICVHICTYVPEKNRFLFSLLSVKRHLFFSKSRDEGSGFFGMLEKRTMSMFSSSFFLLLTGSERS